MRKKKKNKKKHRRVELPNDWRELAAKILNEDIEMKLQQQQREYEEHMRKIQEQMIQAQRLTNPFMVTPPDYLQPLVYSNPSVHRISEAPVITVESATPEVLPEVQKEPATIENRITEIINKVLNETFKTVETRTNDILKEANKLAAATKTIVGIKFNDAPVAKFADGAHPMLPSLLIKVKGLKGSNVYLKGPAGCGKTTLVGQVAEALGLPFGHISFSEGASETWLYGRQVGMELREAEFSRMYREGGVFLMDELDAANDNLLIAFNTALANGHLYNPILGQSFKRHKDFFVIGAGNTFGKGADAVYTARGRLDGSTIDRFVPISMGYLREIEDKILVGALADKIRKVRELIKLQGAHEVVSYRAFEKARDLQLCGDNDQTIIDTLTLSWPSDLKEGLKKIL